MLRGVIMAETVNIGIMAELISKEIFSLLGWSVSGPMNENSECVDESHCRNTHPADIVFSYPEPYEDKVTHVLCDLKSYAKGSITSTSLKNAITNLNQSLACARKNIDWKDKYVFTEKNINIKAMLFIYNHDNEYDSEFQSVFLKATENINIDPGNIISVIGPRKISYLSNICSNIVNMRGKKILPDEGGGFFYPEQPIRKIYHDPASLPLTLEQISGSFHIFRYFEDNEKNIVNGLDVYVEEKESEFKNFQYIFDYLRKNNCIQSAKKIRIFVPFSGPSTRTNFEKALRLYEETVDQDFAEKLKPIIHYEHMHVMRPQFFSEEIGMRYE